MSSLTIYVALPKVLGDIIREYKSGAELWDLLMEHDSRPDVGMSITPYSTWSWYVGEMFSDLEVFHTHIFHSLECRLMMVAKVCGQGILMENPEKDYFSMWSTGDYDLNYKIGVQVFSTYLAIVTEEIAAHDCSIRLLYPTPTRKQWVQYDNRKLNGWSFNFRTPQANLQNSFEDVPVCED